MAVAHGRQAAALLVGSGVAFFALILAYSLVRPSPAGGGQAPDAQRLPVMVD